MATRQRSRIIIFDDGLGQLGPMTDLRASFELRTGMHTTAARIVALRPRTLAGYWVPSHLAAVVSARANAPVNVLPDEETLCCVNGRWALPDERLDLAPGEAIAEEGSGHIVAAHLRRADAEYFLTTRELHERTRIRRVAQRLLYKYPWDVMALLKRAIPHDILSVRLLEAKVPARGDVLGHHPVEVHRSATIGPNVVFDAEAGPIVVHEEAVVRPNVVLCGPCSIGRQSTVTAGAQIKANTVIGPVCKVGGEIGGTIFQGYANKSHDGHLGDSWVGKWVNFGAGTTNSNLLNTYGEVTMRVEADGPRHRTGLQFLGAIVGDHVKTAIGTRIMTGSVIGTGAMLAATAAPPASVRRFAWLADSGEHVYQYGKFVTVMKEMMSRRGESPDEAYLALLKQLHTEAAERSGT